MRAENPWCPICLRDLWLGSLLIWYCPKHGRIFTDQQVWAEVTAEWVGTIRH